MKVAVTGASGFLGGHVLRALAVRPGVEIVAVSRTPPVAMPGAGVRHVALDIAEATEADYDRIGRPERMIHLAWGGLPNYTSLHHFEAELPAQYRFLKAMVSAGLPSLLVTGTCYEYGMQSGELGEELVPAPANPYGHAKLALYRQLQLLQTEKAFELTWARLFYMWGEGQAPTSLYSLLRAAIARGETSFPMSGGEQLRDFLPVGQVAETLVALALGDGGAGLVNLCSGTPVSVRALVERWIAESGSVIVPELGRYPYPSHEPMAFWGSRARLDAVLNRQGKADTF